MTRIALVMATIFSTIAAISNINLYGIEDNVTVYVGANIPVWAEIENNTAESNIDWILNHSEFLNVETKGNQAMLFPISEGGTDVMVRLDDGSFSSRSVYVLSRYFSSETSDFSVTAGIKPIKQYGIVNKVFQFEVDPTLDSGDKISSLKNYLSEMKKYGELTANFKETLIDNYTIMQLFISGIDNKSLEIRLDNADSSTNELISILNKLPDLEFSPILPPSTEEPNSDEDAQILDPDLSVSNSYIDQLKDILVELDGIIGEGTSISPVELTETQILSHPKLLQLLQQAYDNGLLSVEVNENELGDKRYRLRLITMNDNGVNNFYIDVIISHTGSEHQSSLIPNPPSDNSVTVYENVEVPLEESLLEHKIEDGKLIYSIINDNNFTFNIANLKSPEKSKMDAKNLMTIIVDDMRLIERNIELYGATHLVQLDKRYYIVVAGVFITLVIYSCNLVIKGKKSS